MWSISFSNFTNSLAVVFTLLFYMGDSEIQIINLAPILEICNVGQPDFQIHNLGIVQILLHGANQFHSIFFFQVQAPYKNLQFPGWQIAVQTFQLFSLLKSKTSYSSIKDYICISTRIELIITKMGLEMMNDMRRAMIDGGNTSILPGGWIRDRWVYSPISLHSAVDGEAIALDRSRTP